MHQHLHYRRLLAKSEREGSALVMSLAILSMMSAIVLAYMSVAVDSNKFTEHTSVEMRLENAAESVTVLALDSIWGQFEQTLAGNEPTTLELRLFLDDIGVPHEADLDNATRVDIQNLVGFSNQNGEQDVLSGVVVEDVRLWRQDELSATRLFFSATVAERALVDGGNNTGTITRTVEQVWVIDRSEWQGVDYALLANNINCVMCHTDVDNAQRFYSENPADFGTFERVKLGSLESFQLREDPHSSIAGTVYLAGQGLKANGKPITRWDRVKLKSREFDGTGMLVQDVWGDLNPKNLSPADVDDPMAFENLYLGYRGGNDVQVDGYLPDSFPSPFPDDGGYDPLLGGAVIADAGNRKVDSSEFYATTALANGAISGGSIGISPPGNVISTPEQLATLQAGTAAGLDSVTSGNVVLIGTEDNPILLNGEVAIDGDVIIQGYVKGMGSLKVSGNVYMPGDVEYLDGAVPITGGRTFGMDAGGEENGLAIASGGNIMVGNIFHPTWGEGDRIDGTPDTNFNFIMDELALFNRMEWMKTQPKLPGKKKNVLVETIEHSKWKMVEEFYDEEVPVFGMVDTGLTYEEDIWEWQDTGETREEPIYEWQDTGETREVPVYERQREFPNRPAGYQGSWIDVQVGTEEEAIWERVEVGTRDIAITERVLVGTRNVPIMERQQTGTRMEERSRWVQATPPEQIFWTEEVWERKRPDLDNAYYIPGHIPRYYTVNPESPVAIFNKRGYYDPNSDVWRSAERAEEWNNRKLTLADPTDPSDPLLFAPDGQPIAVISSLTSTGGWMDDDIMHDMMKDTLAARDSAKPLEVDATLYSNNSIFGIIPGRNAPGLEGKMIVNGAMIAADVGLLAPNGLQLNFDPRGRELLTIMADQGVTIRRQLWAPSRH